MVQDSLSSVERGARWRLRDCGPSFQFTSLNSNPKEKSRYPYKLSKIENKAFWQIFNIFFQVTLLYITLPYKLSKIESKAFWQIVLTYFFKLHYFTLQYITIHYIKLQTHLSK